MSSQGRSEAVLITGCSTGIGRATAQHLAQNGHTVYATARRLDSIQDLEQHGCKLLELDVTDEASMAAAVRAVEDAEGAVGVLVNNAGYSQSGALESIPMDAVRRQFETNVFGLVRMTQLALPGMRRQRWGRIINISSMGGKVVFPGGAFYHGTKFAVEAISDALRFEVKGFGIDVVIVEPGLIKTDFGSTLVGALADHSGDDAYADFNAAVSAASAGAYEGGGLARFGAGPDAVAKAIARAIKRPRPRVPVTASARLLMGLRRLMSARMWDRSMRTNFPQPKP
jgi:NADP-dependent 3-hydroxy acid dehydrogenase YdfG